MPMGISPFPPLQPRSLPEFPFGSSALSCQQPAYEQFPEEGLTDQLHEREGVGLKIKVAVLDMAGTTIADQIHGTPFVLEAFVQTFRSAGLVLTPDDLNERRGLDKRQVIQTVLAERKTLVGETLEEETDRLLEMFRTCCLDLLGEVTAAPGAIEAIGWLQNEGISVALASGLPQEIAEAMARSAGLAGPGKADYVTSAERAGGGRPGPDMINDVLIHLGCLDPLSEKSRPSDRFDYAQVLKVGDTPVDVREGRGVGAVTIAVSSGTHTPERLREEGPLMVLDSVGDLPDFLSRYGDHVKPIQ
jgi:phosphoglycolate phosphatase-like HAD superfamily hydrolase